MKWGRYLITLLLVGVMCSLVEYSGERELLFPEVLALCLGAWIADRQPWKVNRLQLFGMMTLSALFGMCVVRFVPVPIVAQVAVSFAFAALLLTVTGTTLVPVLSACILPVLLHTDTWIYPVSVCALSGVVILVQYGLEKYGVRPRTDQTVFLFPVRLQRVSLVRWAKQWGLVTAFALIALALRLPLLVAPPLIVTFVELCNPESAARQSYKRVFFSLAAAACLGAGLRLVIQVWLGGPLWLAGTLAALGLFVCFERLRFLFPPAGAIALLPLLLQADVLPWYPLQVAVGGCLFICAALYLFRPASFSAPAREMQE